MGDEALVLLPTPGSKLEVSWQGPYTVTKELNDGLNYELHTGKTHKQRHTYHINLLSKWQSRDKLAALIMPESTEMLLSHEQDVPKLSCEETWEDVVISDHLKESQKDQVEMLLQEYADVFSDRLNLTDVVTH